MANYEGVPTLSSNIPEWVRRMAVVVNRTLQGKVNSVFTCTLNANATTTTVSVSPQLLTNDSYIQFMPTTATAATAFGSGGFYVSNRDPVNNQFTVTHPNTADADKTFTYIILG